MDDDITEMLREAGAEIYRGKAAKKVHTKLTIAEFDGADGRERMVITGSDNFASLTLENDDLDLVMDLSQRPKIYDAYTRFYRGIVRDDTKLIEMSEDSGIAASESVRAGQVYAVSLEEQVAPDSAVGRAAQRVTRGLVRAVSLTYSATVGDYSLAPSGRDLVVTRLSDGSEVVRTGAGDVEEAGVLLAHVQEQLRTLSAAEFDEAWTVSAAGQHL